MAVPGADATVRCTPTPSADRGPKCPEPGVDIAADRGLHELYAEVLPENADMLAVLREHGEHEETRDGTVVTVTLPVPPSRT